MCLKRIVHAYSFNSLRPGDAYMRHWNESELIQVMACRLFGAKPLPEPMVDYCQLGIKFIELFLSRLHGRIFHRFGGRYCSSAGYSNKIFISVSSLWLVKSHDKHSRDLLKWGPEIFYWWFANPAGEALLVTPCGAIWNYSAWEYFVNMPRWENSDKDGKHTNWNCPVSVTPPNWIFTHGSWWCF